MSKSQQIIISQSNNWYTPDFDKELGDKLIEEVQEIVGCFECGTPAPKLRCSRCKLAKYCHAECQKTDWKKTHKSLCRTYLETSRGSSDNNPDPVPILLKSVGLLSEPMFVKSMLQRRVVFLEAVASQKTEGTTMIFMDFTCSVVDMFDKLRIVADATFQVYENNYKQKVVVPYILVEVIDDSQAAIQACHKNDGKLSDEAFAKVLDTWVIFHQQLCEASIKLGTLTCGNGLVNRIDELKYKLEAKGVSGLTILPTITF